MKIIYKEPFKEINGKEIGDNPQIYIKEIREMIKGEFDHFWLPHQIKLLHNINGKSLKLSPNVPVDHDLILGNVIFIGTDSEDNFTSLSELQEAYIRKNYYI